LGRNLLFDEFCRLLAPVLDAQHFADQHRAAIKADQLDAERPDRPG
jgi:hypothetical protein